MQTEAQILERAERLNFPVVVSGGGTVSGAGPWHREAALPGARAGLSLALDELEAEEARRAARASRDVAEEAAGAELDETLAGQERIEDEMARQDFIARRPERVEQRLSEMLSELRSISAALKR